MIPDGHINHYLLSESVANIAGRDEVTSQPKNVKKIKDYRKHRTTMLSGANQDVACFNALHTLLGHQLACAGV